MNNCTNCGLPAQADLCANCEQFRKRLDKLRAEQSRYWQEVRSGARELSRPARRLKGSHAFKEQCAKHGKQRQNDTLKGQDAALPKGDRE